MMMNENKELKKAGFYSKDFRRSMLRLQQHFTLEEIIELYRAVADLLAAGIDPVRELRSLAGQG